MSQAAILSKLEASRKELLDLGLRNPLLNYKLPKSRGLHIVQEKSSFIYDILVGQSKMMSFLNQPDKGSDDDTPEEEMTESELLDTYSDNKLQTNETDVSLQSKLLNTYYSARTSMEEQGVNILYITLGMLHWFESESSEEERLAPLILIPVTLERSSARERFRVKHSLEDVGGNISLQAKMKNDFGVLVPDLPEADDLNMETYFAKVKSAIAKTSRWRIENDEIELGFFSFGKFMIYNDLDSTKWPEQIKPASHPLLQGLLDRGFGNEQLSVPEEAFIDKDTNAHELFQVVDADSSQVLAMLAVRDGKNLVIQGPPGTGKSQTITNIIADAIGQGKKVLFVAEKMAALEVVKRRLDTINIGEACLELHSHKANKKELHKELRRILELGKPSLQQLKQEVSLLENHKMELNDYCSAVNTIIGNSNLTTHKVIGRLLRVSDLTRELQLPKINLHNIHDWDNEKMIRAEAFAERIQARLSEIGIPSKLLFWGCELTVLLPHEQPELLTLLKESRTVVESLMNDVERIATQMGLEVPTDRPESKRLTSLCNLISTQPDLRGVDIKNVAWLLNESDIQELLSSGERLTQLQDKYKDLFIPEAWDQNVLEIRNNLLAYGDKWYKFLMGSYRKCSKQLAGLCKAKLPKESAAKLQYVDDILEYKRLEKVENEFKSLAKTIFNSQWQGRKSNWISLKAISGYLHNIHQQIANGAYPQAIVSYLIRHESPDICKKNHDSLMRLLDKHQNQIEQLIEKLSLNEQLIFSKNTFPDQLYIQQKLSLNDWIQRLPEIHKAILWNTLSETADAENLKSLITASINWDQAKDYLKVTLQKTWYEYLIEQAIKTHPPLRKFERASHEELMRQFRKLDQLNLQFNRVRVAAKHWEGLPRLEAGGQGQMNILRTEFNKKSRFKPIRKVMEDAGLAIQLIKPVFMMSPMSIANFLPPGSVQFDIVIFDEASQVRPVDALGALLRGNQVVVVGDTKQLPPTSFFDSLTNEVDDEENVTSDIQSILGMCDAQGAPQRMLRWHYRSRHESLISLSNHEFYENKLVIFPSPGSKHRMGLSLHHSKDTVYDRGKTRTNPKEAEIVAEAVLNHALKYPKLSLGVVAFSTAQRQAIQDTLEMKRKGNPDAEAFFKSHSHEPFFVKNLENVQGDERDVIFISVGYGRTEEGYVSMSFGPLNNEGGERRLNVLITRAKQRCQIFTNITSEDIDTSKTKSYGVRALKHFLYFAKHGKLNVTEETGLPADSPFEENVADKLTQMGYLVRKQIGSQGFYIDLAIVDPENPGRYIIGIECDGASYHSARSARDRDRLRQLVLENIGWRIHRIWSTDWFRNPEQELKRVVESIEKAKEIMLVDDESSQDEELDSQHIELVREDVEESRINIPPYECAKLSREIARQELHLHPIGKLAAWIVEVVKAESPVHVDEVARRIGEAGGVSRIGARIRDSLDYATKSAMLSHSIKRRDDFLWDANMDTPIIRDRSSLPNNARKVNYIAPEEILVAIELAVRNSIAIRPEDAVPIVVKMFGFARVTEEMKQDVLQVIHRGVSQKIIALDGELLKPLVNSVVKT